MLKLCFVIEPHTEAVLLLTPQEFVHFVLVDITCNQLVSTMFQPGSHCRWA